MVELNHRDHTIKVKLVYYGPPVGGKTTNLQILYRQADARRRGELVSINSSQDRTILFDLLPLKTPGLRGFDLRLQILAVPGQAIYAATRRLVLKGADSLVFVANSALDRWEENIQSYREMTQNLLSHRLDPAQMPLVFQYNKRDLPQVLEIEALDRALNGRRADVIPAVAVRGEGVLETLTAILARTVQHLGQRYAILDIKEAAPAKAWAEHTVHDMFGTTHLSPESRPAPREMPSAPPPARPGPSAAVAAASAAPVAAFASASGAALASGPTPPAPPASGATSTAGEPPAPSPATVPAAPRRPISPPPPLGPTVLRVAPPPPLEEARVAPSAPDARASDLVETYAEASAQLGSALTELREERDLVRQQVDDLRQTLATAQEILSGVPLEAALRPVLELIARLSGADQAAFWVPEAGKPPRAAALVGLAEDPVVASPAALRHVLNAGRGTQPGLVFAADSADFAEALARAGGGFVAALVVPFRTPGGLQGVAVCYYGPDTARPGPGALEHLGELPRALAVALELAATLHTVKAAERALELALSGSASLRGLENVVRALEEVKDRLGEMRERPDAPSWLAEQSARLEPGIAAALADGRSFLGFARGEVSRDRVYVEDLLAELRTPEVTMELDPSGETILADATLVRVALRAVLDDLRARIGSNAAPVALQTRAVAGSLLIRLGAAPATASAGALNAGFGVGLARRIAELHGGTLLEQNDPAGQWLVLSLPSA